MNVTKTDRITIHGSDTAEHTSFDNLIMRHSWTFVQYLFRWIEKALLVCKYCERCFWDLLPKYCANAVEIMAFVSQKVRRFGYRVWTGGGRSTLSRSVRYKSNSGFVTPARTLEVNVLACCVPERGVGDTRHGIKRADGGFLYPSGNLQLRRLSPALLKVIPQFLQGIQLASGVGNETRFL